MARELISLTELNALPPAEFCALLGSVFEHSGWVAEATADERPFASLTKLHQVMMGKIEALPVADQEAFLRGHPRLSPASLKTALTAESTAEQTAAGIAQLDSAARERLDGLNAAYEAKFGFPFILAVRYASFSTLMASFERRLNASPETERLEALKEISAITWMRLLDRVRPAPTGSLSTHVLDTVRAAPAAGLGAELWQKEINGTERQLFAFKTDANGASEVDLLGDGALTAGTYEWRFDTPSYFAAHGYATPARAFFGKINVAFTVWNPEEHFHVPVLLTPGSYTTYRGS